MLTGLLAYTFTLLSTWHLIALYQLYEHQALTHCPVKYLSSVDLAQACCLTLLSAAITFFFGRNRRQFHGATVVLSGLVFVILLADSFVAVNGHYSGLQIDSNVLENNPGLKVSALFLTQPFPALLFITSLIGALGFYFIQQDNRSAQLSGKRRSVYLILIILVSSIVLSWRWNVPSECMTSPHIFLAETYLQTRSAQLQAQKSPEPSKAMIEKLEGIGVSYAANDRSYPFLKKSIYFDAKHRSTTKPNLPPGTNIVAVFVESLSSWFVDSPALEKAGVTPHMRKIFSDHYQFTNMQSAIRPTMKGLVAGLGSFLLPRADKNLLEQESLQKSSIHFSLLPERLKNVAGYHTVFINGARCEFGTMESLLRSNGFDEYFCSSRPPMRHYAHSPMSIMGMRDADTFAFARSYLESYRGSKPLFLAISTTETHFPFDAEEPE